MQTSRAFSCCLGLFAWLCSWPLALVSWQGAVSIVLLHGKAPSHPFSPHPVCVMLPGNTDRLLPMIFTDVRSPSIPCNLTVSPKPFHEKFATKLSGTLSLPIPFPSASLVCFSISLTLYKRLLTWLVHKMQPVCPGVIYHCPWVSLLISPPHLPVASPLTQNQTGSCNLV